uniref:Longin domain-containing protein n=1 Tax=Kalanchoe fedtschenkoi TaxID=63787 RepID=A0A7N0V847_KALFE
MFPDPCVVLYACVSSGNPATILADFNPGNDPDVEASAVQRLQITPPYHSTFSHTIDNRTYTYLIAGDNADSQVVFFGIFDSIQEAEQGIPLLFLSGVKERFDSLVAKRKNRAAGLKTFRGLQSAADELFLEPLGLQSSAAGGSRSKGVKSVCERFLGLAMCVVDSNKKSAKKKKKAAAAAEKEQSSFGSSNEHSDCALVADSKHET